MLEGMNSIFQYESPNEVLRSTFDFYKSKNPRFSLRAFTRKLGLNNHSHLSRILNGQKKFPKSFLPILIKQLQLTKKESQYLELLIDLEHASTEREKDYYTKRLAIFHKKKIEFTEVKNFDYISEPIHTHIIDMFDLKGFTVNIDWIQEKFKEKYTKEEVREAVDNLIEMGIIKSGGNGFYRAKQSVRNEVDIPSLGVIDYHRNVSLMARNSVVRDERSEREFNGFSLAIKEEDFESAREKLRDFIEDFLNEFEVKDNDGDKLYQLNVQFFPLTERVT